MEKSKVRNRDTNFELLRIIAMILIVMLHFKGYSPAPKNLPFAQDIARLFIYFPTLVGVDIYVMITGYYMINKNSKFIKLIKMEVMTIFYGVILFAISLIWNKEFTLTDIIKQFTPFLSEKYWFITCYFALYLMIPFLNKFIKSLSKEKHLYLLIMLTILISFVTTINPLNQHLSGDRFNVIWFIYLYILASYIRLHFNKRISNGKLILGIVTINIIQVILFVTFSIFRNTTYKDQFQANNSPLVLTQAILVFLLFRNIKIKNEYINKIILTIAPLTFGVYVLHENYRTRMIMWTLLSNLSSNYWFLYLINVVIVFCGGCAIEYLRAKLFALLGQTSFFREIDMKLTALTEKVERKIE